MVQEIRDLLQGERIERRDEGTKLPTLLEGETLAVWLELSED